MEPSSPSVVSCYSSTEMHGAVKKKKLTIQSHLSDSGHLDLSLAAFSWRVDIDSTSGVQMFHEANPMR